jgi:uncharacterized protein (UPF0332 family)
VTGEHRRQNLDVEIEKGCNSLRAARTLLDLGLWDDAVSRAYYAAFHHVQALLFTEGIEPRSHRGTHDLLYLHFVRPGRFDAELSRLFVGLQKYREQADYAASFRFAEAGARTEAANAERICAAVIDLLRADGWLSPAPTA